MALPLKGSIHTDTYTAGEDLSASTRDIPLKYGTDDDELIKVTGVTDWVVGYLQDVNEFTVAGKPISVANREGDLIHAIGGATTFAAGATLKLEATSFNLEPFAINLAGATPVTMQGIACEDWKGDGKLFLMEIRRDYTLAT